MSHKNILIAVQPDFNSTHVGVLRVIRYHFKDLVARGHSVTLATPRDGKWITCSLLDASRVILGDGRRTDVQKPYWQSGAPLQGLMMDNVAHAPHWPVEWNGEAVAPEDFDESILTNPWLLAKKHEPVPDSRFTVGIVHDLVPNLIALGILRMPQFIDIYDFAHEHHIGYDYYVRNVETIACVSENTRRDFRWVYGEGVASKLAVCIPFSDFGTAPIPHDPEARDILMINVLDHRKNFLTVAKSLKEASATAKLHVVIVGRERMPRNEVLSFLSELAQVCASVRWYRGPSDAQLQELMSHAKAVFFPSVYEGLGLPILEAQARGVPVISSNNSSCGEINLNRTLTADPYDYKAFAAKLIDIHEGTAAVLRGPALRQAQLEFLNTRNKLFIPH